MNWILLPLSVNHFLLNTVMNKVTWHLHIILEKKLTFKYIKKVKTIVCQKYENKKKKCSGNDYEWMLHCVAHLRWLLVLISSWMRACLLSESISIVLRVILISTTDFLSSRTKSKIMYMTSAAVIYPFETFFFKYCSFIINVKLFKQMRSKFSD